MLLHTYVVVRPGGHPLQLGFRLEQRSQLLSQHDVSGDLQFTLHEGCLWLQFAQRQIHHIAVGDGHRGVGLALHRTLVHLGVLQVQH